MLKPVLYKFHICSTIGLLGNDGEIGKIEIRIIPIDNQGEIIDEDDEEYEIEVPDDLIERGLSCHFKFFIENIEFQDITEIINKKAFIKYETMS